MDAQWQALGVDPQRMRALAALAEAESAEEKAQADDECEDDIDDGADVELGPEDWRAWRVFLACRRAWRIVAGMGGIWYEGIDPSAVLSTLQMLQIKPKHWPDVHYRLAILEGEARTHLNKPLADD